jgi:enoyl-CoA hydratase/carnithine racemase
VVTNGQLLEAALELGEMIAADAPMAITTTKEVMWTNVHAGNLDQALALESRNQIKVRATADAAEARQSFLEKRSPVFASPAGPRPLR